MSMDPTFWLLISFILFFVLAFKKVKTVTGEAINKYYQDIKGLISAAESKANQSSLALKEALDKTKEVKEISNKLQSNAVIEGERLKNEMMLKVTSYLAFKEKYIEEKIEIFIANKLQELKHSIALRAIEVAQNYIKYESSNRENITAEKINEALESK